MYLYIYIYEERERERERQRERYIHIYIYMHIYMCMYVFMYVTSVSQRKGQPVFGQGTGFCPGVQYRYMESVTSFRCISFEVVPLAGHASGYIQVFSVGRSFGFWLAWHARVLWLSP